MPASLAYRPVNSDAWAGTVQWLVLQAYSNRRPGSQSKCSSKASYRSVSRTMSATFVMNSYGGLSVGSNRVRQVIPDRVDEVPDPLSPQPVVYPPRERVGDQNRLVAVGILPFQAGLERLVERRPWRVGMVHPDLVVIRTVAVGVAFHPPAELGVVAPTGERRAKATDAECRIAIERKVTADVPALPVVGPPAGDGT